MTVEEAIKTALVYEKKIRDLYRDSTDKAIDPAGKRLFGALADDEQNHVAYLEDRLAQWQSSGLITARELETTLPDAETIRRGLERITPRMDRDDRRNEKQMLSKALHLEVETSRFYEKMVGEMADEAQKMFARFLEIENGHIQAVEAELDYLSHTGYWLDIKEFGMEGY